MVENGIINNILNTLKEYNKIKKQANRIDWTKKLSNVTVSVISLNINRLDILIKSQRLSECI